MRRHVSNCKNRDATSSSKRQKRSTADLWDEDDVQQLLSEERFTLRRMAGTRGARSSKIRLLLETATNTATGWALCTDCNTLMPLAVDPSSIAEHQCHREADDAAEMDERDEVEVSPPTVAEVDDDEKPPAVTNAAAADEVDSESAMPSKEEVQELLHEGKLVLLTSNRSRSAVWNKVRMVCRTSTGEYTGWASCNDCQHLMRFRTKIGTSNLIKHMKVCSSPAALTSAPQQSDAKRRSSSGSAADYRSCQQRMLRLTAAWLSQSNRPAGIVDDMGFQLICQELIRIGTTLGNISADEVMPLGQAEVERAIADYSEVANGSSVQ